MNEDVLFVALSIDDRYGGIESFNRRLVRALTELPTDETGRVVVVSLTDREIRDLGSRGTFIACRGARMRLVWRVARILRRQRPGRIILGHINLLPLALLARLLHGPVRVALVAHGFEAWGDPRFRRSRLHERLLLRGVVDRVLAVSRHTAERLARNHRVTDARCRIFLNAIDLDEDAPPAHGRAPQDAATGRVGRARVDPSPAPRLLSVTKLAATETGKGIDQVIEAVARLRTRHPDLVYEVVGDGALRDALAQRAVARGVASHVHFLGALDADALEDAYRRAAVFVLPSRKEGFGIVFLEAWKHGLPVVCGDGDASPEVVGDGGLAVDPDDPDALTEALSRLLRDPDERRRLACDGHARLRSLYTHRHFTSRLRELLADLSHDGASVRRAEAARR